MEEREKLIGELDRARAQMKAVLEAAGPGAAATPEWGMKEMVAHLAGWDALTREALRRHAAGLRGEVTARGDLDACNARFVAERQGLDYEQTVEEWERTHAEMRQALVEMPAERLAEKLVFPWGPKGTVARLVAIIAGHEREHTKELKAPWG